jgi:hypothetical protein
LGLYRFLHFLYVYSSFEERLIQKHIALVC